MRWLAFPLIVFLVGSASAADKASGLAAWDRIFEVASHPRCANCHVGPSDRPMWTGKSYGAPRVHGMNVRGGESRAGGETLPCAACHGASKTPQNTPHAPPRVDGVWALAPPEAHWFGQSSQAICAQLRDPKRNGNRTVADIAAHLDHDKVLGWAWSPGPGREPAPYSLTAHIEDILAWGAAGQPCPQDP